jgi:uncharacterized protein YdaU (DUF1376 family)
MHYYNFNIGDYMKHTLHLTPEEDLAYRRLLDMYYDSESPIPNNIPLVSRRLRIDSKVVESVLNEFFELTEDGYRNYRADGEIADYHKYLAKQQANGKLGGRPKKSQRKPIANPAITQDEPKKSLNNNQQTTNNKQDINTPDGVSESIFKDYLEVRKAKKAKWTQTALKGLQREAEKAKMSLQDVIQLCCERNWVGFKAEWANSQNPVSKQGDDKSWMFSNQGIEAKAKELGVNDYGIHNHQQLKDKVLLVMAKKAMQ